VTQRRGAFLSWIDFHGRSDGIARRLRIEPLWVAQASGNLLLRYLKQWRATVRELRSRELDFVIVMQPPSPALLATLWALRGRDVTVVADFHTGALVGRKWGSQAPLLLRLLKRRGFAVVTNEVLAERVISRGVRCITLHDIIEHGPQPDVGAQRERSVLFPVTYASDEPIDAVLEAARSLKDVTFVLTGRPPGHVVESAPDNVEFPGFVSADEYERLLRACGAVAALTTREHTMQRAGYEALTFAKPLVTSDMEVLRNYFGGAAEYAEPTAASIASAIVRALSDGQGRSSLMAILRDAKIVEQEEAFDRLRSELMR